MGMISTSKVYLMDGMWPGLLYKSMVILRKINRTIYRLSIGMGEDQQEERSAKEGV